MDVCTGGPRPLSRRSFLAAAGAATGLELLVGRRAEAYTPVLRLPASTSNGAKVPIAVDIPHPMEPDHYITSVHVINQRDPVPSKGVFHFTPASGRAFVAFQARLDAGLSKVVVIAECNRHGRRTSEETIRIAPGGGGCAGAAPPPGRFGPDDIRPPAIRLPALVAEGHITRDAIISVQLKTRHPVRTGLAERDGRFVQEADPFYLTEMDVVYGEERVCRFLMTPAISDNPLITFTLRARRDAPVRITLLNNRGQRFEAVHPIRFV